MFLSFTFAIGGLSAGIGTIAARFTFCRRHSRNFTNAIPAFFAEIIFFFLRSLPKVLHVFRLKLALAFVAASLRIKPRDEPSFAAFAKLQAQILAIRADREAVKFPFRVRPLVHSFQTKLACLARENKKAVVVSLVGRN